jgi:Ca2+-transporting ATPase
MGINGDTAAREVADIFLHTEDLTRIALAIEQGRTTHANIRKSLRFLLGTNSSEIMLMLASIAAGLGEALTPLQLLWINVITDVLPGIGLALEAPEAGVMEQAPQPADRPILGSEETRRLLAEGVTMTAGALTAGLYGACRYGNSSPQLRTLMFSSLVGTQLVHAFNCRSEADFAQEPAPSNQSLNSIVAVSAAVQASLLFGAPTRRLLGLAPLSWADIGVVFTASGLPFLINRLGRKEQSLVEARQIFRFRRREPNCAAEVKHPS